MKQRMYGAGIRLHLSFLRRSPIAVRLAARPMVERRLQGANRCAACLALLRLNLLLPLERRRGALVLIRQSLPSLRHM